MFSPARSVSSSTASDAGSSSLEGSETRKATNIIFTIQRTSAYEKVLLLEGPSVDRLLYISSTY